YACACRWELFRGDDISNARIKPRFSRHLYKVIVDIQSGPWIAILLAEVRNAYVTKTQLENGCAPRKPPDLRYNRAKSFGILAQVKDVHDEPVNKNVPIYQAPFLHYIFAGLTFAKFNVF